MGNSCKGRELLSWRDHLLMINRNKKILGEMGWSMNASSLWVLFQHQVTWVGKAWFMKEEETHGAFHLKSGSQ